MQAQEGEKTASASEPAAKGARRVSQPLQMAPPHSIRPPKTPPVEAAKAVEASAKEIQTAATAPAEAKDSSEDQPVAEDVRKKA